MERESVKKTAIKMAKAHGLTNLVCAELCEQARLPRGSFKHVMGCSFVEFVEELRGEVADDGVHEITKSRVAPEARTAHILTVAIQLAKRDGYANVKREELAELANVSEATVARYTGTRDNLRMLIMKKANDDGVPEIIAQGLALGDPIARNASIELKAQAATILVNS